MTFPGPVGPPVALLRPLNLEHPMWGAIVFNRGPYCDPSTVFQWSAGRQFKVLRVNGGQAR